GDRRARQRRRAVRARRHHGHRAPGRRRARRRGGHRTPPRARGPTRRDGRRRPRARGAGLHGDAHGRRVRARGGGRRRPERVVTAPAPKRTPSLAHRVEYGAIRSFIGTLGLLGRERALRAGAALGAAAYRPLGVRRRVVERQIAAAFPELDAAGVRAIAAGAYRHLGRVAVETALMSRMGPTEVLALFERVDNWHVVEEKLALGRGLIAASGHLGNWELCAAYVAAHGAHVDAVIRRMGNPLFDAYVSRVRSRLGLTVVRDRESVRRTPRTLGQGGVVGILVDQAGLNIASTYVNFFGRPAKTPRGAAV